MYFLRQFFLFIEIVSSLIPLHMSVNEAGKGICFVTSTNHRYASQLYNKKKTITGMKPYQLADCTGEDLKSSKAKAQKAKVA